MKFCIHFLFLSFFFFEINAQNIVVEQTKEHIYLEGVDIFMILPDSIMKKDMIKANKKDRFVFFDKKEKFIFTLMNTKYTPKICEMYMSEIDESDLLEKENFLVNGLGGFYIKEKDIEDKKDKRITWMGCLGNDKFSFLISYPLSKDNYWHDKVKKAIFSFVLPKKD